MAISDCISAVDSRGRELVEHGTQAFPIACYHDDLGILEVPWHWHEEWEAVVIEKGKALVAAGTEKYTVHSGEGFFIRSGVVHGCWDLEHSGCRFHSLVFHPRLIGGSPDSVYHQHYVLPLLDAPGCESIHLRPEVPWQQSALAAIEQAWQQCAYAQAGYEMHVRTALTALAWELKNHLPSGQESADAKTLRDSERLKRMLEYIDAHLTDPLTAGIIARSASISESECLRCFHTTIGVTPIQYLRRRRIQRAVQLLVSTKKKTADIAMECGFQDLSYFAKTFRIMEGCTPTEYRRSHQKED